MKKYILTVSLFLYVSILLFSQSKADDITGLWYMHEAKDGAITVAELYKQNNKYYSYGFDFKVKGSSKEVYDVNNPNVAKRKNTLKGLVVVYDLTFDGKEWKNGKIYNPENGKTFNLQAKLKDKNTLILRASVDNAGIFGATMEWKRVEPNNSYKVLDKSELHFLP